MAEECGVKILLVGAGAVGQVFGRHLQKGGAEVSFYVREKYAEEARGGFTMYAWNEHRDALKHPLRFEGFGVLTTLEEVASTTWDQVYLCVSSTVLRAGWLGDFVAQLGDATLVCLQPGMHDKAYLLQYISEERVVMGTIGFNSYYAPMPGEEVEEEGVAYWFPFFSPSPFSGSERVRLQGVLRALRAGKLPCMKMRDVVEGSVYISAVLMFVVTALECHEWSFSKLSKSPLLRDIPKASFEVFVVLSKTYRPPAPLWLVKLVLRPFALRFGLWLAPRLIPFDIEQFFRTHFEKVGDQTELYLLEYLDAGGEHQTKTVADWLSRLRQCRG